MKEFSDSQIEVIKEALERATHKDFETCAASVCEKIKEALKILNE